MRLSRAVVFALAGVAIAAPACFDRTPRGSSSSVGAESAVFTSFRGPLHGTLTIRPPAPRPGEAVQVELAGRDERGGNLTLSVAYDGRRPDDEGAAGPDRCPSATPGEPSRASRTESRTFDRPGTYELRLLVLSLRCDDSRAELTVKATVVVAGEPR